MRRLVVLIAVLAATLGLAACGRGPAPAPAPTPTPSPSPTPTPTPTPPPPTRAETVLASLTPEQRAGQLFLAGVWDTGPAADAAVQAGQLAGVLFLGPGWSLEAVQTVASRLTTLGAPVGPYIAADQEGGWVQRLNGAGFDYIPTALEQGAMSPDDLTAAATGWGNQLRQAGVNLNLAPVADTVPDGFQSQNAPIGQLAREFGTDPASNGRHAAAFIAGMRAAGIDCAVKHFPGLGRVVGNTDFTDSGIVDDQTSAQDPYLEAYRLALAADPGMVMVALATYPQIDGSAPAAFSHAVVTDLLRGQLGWDGVVISDSLSATAVAGWTPADRAIAFIRAGGDIAIYDGVEDALAAWQGVVAEMQADPAFADLVGQAALRVLEAKDRLGLLG